MDTKSVLSGLEAIHVATVLEDCVDQLHVLGCLIPASYKIRPDTVKIVRDELSQLVESQTELEKNYQSVLAKKLKVLSKTRQPDKLAALENEVLDAGSDLKTSTHIFARSLRQSPLTSDNLRKLQEDRAYTETVLSEVMTELVQNCSYQTLLDAVTSHKQHKALLESTVIREQEGRKRIKELQKELKDVKKEHEMEIQQRKEMISHLKDQLQEMKAKTSMENKYVSKCADASVAQTRKRCFLSEKNRTDESERVLRRIDEENRAHQEIMSYLFTHKENLEKKLEFWSEKYEVDREDKQRELDTLKQSKAKDLEKLHEMSRLYKEYEVIVVEDRVEKEKARRKSDQEANELKSVIKLQAWWRGVMVRKGLGTFGKKKKKRGKKGKGKKGKGKGKGGKGSGKKGKGKKSKGKK